MADMLIQVGAGIAINLALSYLYRALGTDDATKAKASKINDAQITTAQEGAALQVLYGRMRVNGNIIWATQFVETHDDAGYHYSVSFAVAFCEGRTGGKLLRLLANNKEMDLTNVTYRFYSGTAAQTADPKIQAVEGVDYTPAYRNICYIVFENLPLANYSNSIPVISADLVMPVESADAFADRIHGVNLIPASGEAVYGTTLTSLTSELGNWTVRDNFKAGATKTRFATAIDDLIESCSNITTISVVVAWHGNDLRCNSCVIAPKQEDVDRVLTPYDWSVGSYNRSNAGVPSKDTNGKLYLGGTPSDWSVVEAIAYIKSKGLKVAFYPFIMMDIPPGNVLPNPYSDNAGNNGQAVFPWRGRITISPAPGYMGSPDKTSAAATQINAFFTQYNAFIMHYANLTGVGNTVDYFIIGSELIGLTTSRDALGSYPAVTALKSLAASVRGVVSGTCDILYAADWSEQTHECADGQWFHLDSLWADSNIDIIGIDNYLPLSDWRQGTTHLDYNENTGVTSIYNSTYLQSQIEGGEYYDYYYASSSDRDSQTRTAITDGAGKPWIFRRKDFRNWWSNLHYNRPAWVESGVSTDWIPYSKRIMFTEIGCPAVNFGTNQPNVFYDPKSSESFFPYYSNGLRDDIIQRDYIVAFYAYWLLNMPNEPGNPSNTMFDIDEVCLWAYDARSYPDFPNLSGKWGDTGNYETGHWLNGRLWTVAVGDVVRDICQRAGLISAQINVSNLDNIGSVITGFLIDSVTSARNALQNLANSHSFDSVESNGQIKFLVKNNPTFVTIPSDDIILSDSSTNYTLTIGQYSEVPTAIQISFIDIGNDFQKATIRGSTQRSYTINIESIDLPEVCSSSFCMALADSLVAQSWLVRNSGYITLPLSYSKLEAGDVLRIDNDVIRLINISRGDTLECEFTSYDISLYDMVNHQGVERSLLEAPGYGLADLRFLDIPLITGNEVNLGNPRLAAYATPWPTAVDVYLDVGGATYQLVGKQLYQMIVGITTTALYSGVVDNWDYKNSFQVKVIGGDLLSVSAETLLSQQNCLAVQNTSGGWELIGFTTATLQSDGSYLLSGLLRGLYGTDDAMRDPVAAGAPVVWVDVTKLGSVAVATDTLISSNTYRWGPSVYGVANSAYQNGLFTGMRKGLQPFAPCNAYLAKNSITNDLTINWIRQTRYGGISWEAADIPLNEEIERYRLRVYDGSVLKREVIVDNAQAHLYSSAMQIADFGSNQATVKVTIEQYGSYYGNYGRALSQILAIKYIS